MTATKTHPETRVGTQLSRGHPGLRPTPTHGTPHTQQSRHEHTLTHYYVETPTNSHDSVRETQNPKHNSLPVLTL